MNDPVQDILGRLHGAKQTSAGQWSARCPVHDDRHASLSVSAGADGRALLHCHAGCSNLEILRAIGMRLSDLFIGKRLPGSSHKGRIVAVYDYRDAEGKALFQVVRFEPKSFLQRRSDGDGAWVWGLSAGEYCQGADGDWRKACGPADAASQRRTFPEVPRVLYRLPELIASDCSRWVFITEGEKDVSNLAAVGLTATCNPGGAGKWSKLSDNSALHGHRVAVLADKDEVGLRHGQDVAARLFGKAAELKVLELPGDGKDVSDWLAAGGTAEQLVALADSAPLWQGDQRDQQHDTEGEEDDHPAPQADKMIRLGACDPVTGRIVLSPRRTLPTAEAYVREFHSHPDSRTLQGYAGMLLAWVNNRYMEIEDEAVGNRLQRWLHEALRYVHDRKTGQPELVEFDSNPATVKSALDSIRTYTHVPAATPTPSWLAGGESRPPAEEVLPCRTLNLHIPTGKVMPASPALFTTSALDFDFDASAPAPSAWLKFLGDIWGSDQQSTELLQEWFGYALTADTCRQKILLLVGPKRSGKGTIGRVLRKLVGEANVAGPTTGSLAGPFGLQPLIGKSLAIVSDARFKGDDMPIIVERLLCISGEDALTIDRKFLSSVTMKLSTRFMLLTNELPRLDDASGALAGRFLILQMDKSFYGKEDLALTEKLTAELPGILLWALQGWVRLHNRGHFVQPTSAQTAVRAMEDLTSPVGAFVRECCDVEAGRRAYVDQLYAAWRKWCEAEGRTSVSTRQTFGRDLAAAVPGLASRRNHSEGRFYQGIGIRGELP